MMDRKPDIDPLLLDRLLHLDGTVALETLGGGPGSNDGLREQLMRLRACDCSLELEPAGRVRLLDAGLGAWVDYLKWLLGSRRIVEVYRRTSSTQDVMRRLIENHGREADGAVVVADEQTDGRGRLGRRWVAPQGTAAMFSRAWVHSDVRANPTRDRLLCATAVAVCHALEAILRPLAIDVRIKWPNDLLIGGRKIAGILVESFTSPAATGSASDAVFRAAVIGIGINVSLTDDLIRAHMPKLEGRVTSLAMCGRPVPRLRVLGEVLRRVDQVLAQRDTRSLVDQWRRRSTLIAHRVKLRHDGRIIQGRVVDLDPDDGLIIRTDNGVMTHLPSAATTIL